jgi:hypothetical protein
MLAVFEAILGQIRGVFRGFWFLYHDRQFLQARKVVPYISTKFTNSTNSTTGFERSAFSHLPTPVMSVHRIRAENRVNWCTEIWQCRKNAVPLQWI